MLKVFFHVMIHLNKQSMCEVTVWQTLLPLQLSFVRFGNFAIIHAIGTNLFHIPTYSLNIT